MTLLRMIAVNYFGANTVERLVQSVLAQRNPDWHLVVVDNSESSEQAAILHEICSADTRLEVVIAPGNLGYLHAAEWWISNHERNLATWTAVCNTDLYLRDESFVCRLGDCESSASVLAPDIVAIPSGRRQNPYMVRRPSRTRMLVRRTVLSYRPSAHAALKMANSRRDTGALTPAPLSRDIYAPHGSFMLFRDDYFARGGSLRHGPFLFAEEITIGERARSLGLRVSYEPSLRVSHEEHQSTGKRSKTLFLARRSAVSYAYRLISGKESVPQ